MEREYCLKCMQPNGGVQVCPHCGYESQKKEHLPHVLRPGTVLNDRYLLGLPLGQGGFGITYIGRDLKLDMRVAVKEYYPSGYANRNVEVSDRITITDERLRMAADEGKNRFLKEARAMARFHGTPGIVDVRDYFEANNTAYIIMEYLEGEDLAHRIRKQLFSADEIFHLMSPILDTLEKIHRQDVVHRDISPDNIMMLPDGSLKLMDFGAARIMNYSDQRSMSVMLKAGYAPVEQYRSRGQQGPWTDIYALCATIYKCITGKTPEDALERAFEDELKWPSELGFSISVRQEAALKKGMAVHQQDRFQSISELKAALAEGTTFSAESAHITESRLTEEPPQAELDHPDHTAWIGSSSKPVTTSPKRLSEQRIEPQNDALHVSSKAASDLKPAEPKEASVYPEQERQVKETEKKKATPLKAESKAKKQSTKKKSRVIWVAVLGLALAAIVIWVVIGENRSKRQVTADAVIHETVQATPEPTMQPNDEKASLSEAETTFVPSATPKPTIRPNYAKASSLEAYNTAQAFSAKRYVAAGDWFAVGIKTDGTCIVSGRDAPNLANWKNMVSICASCDNVMGLQSDGKVRCTNLSVGRWTDIRQIDYFTGYIINDGLELYSHGVGLKADGTVVAAGLDRYNECAVETWTGIIDIAAGGRHTVGLKADGTVIATGNNEFGQCNTESWKNIVDVAAANYTTYGLSADGIVYATGQDNIISKSEKWADVVAIIGGYEGGQAKDFVIGITSSRKLVSTRDYDAYVSEKQMDSFSNVVSVAASSWGYTLCVDESGACSSIGPDIDGKRIVETWPAIKTK